MIFPSKGDENTPLKVDISSEDDCESFLKLFTLENIWYVFKKNLRTFFTVLLFYFVTVLFYMHVEQWTVIDSVYFVTVTITTVGYGVLCPSSETSRLFTIFTILVGVLYIVSVLNEYVSGLIEWAEDNVQKVDEFDESNIHEHMKIAKKKHLLKVGFYACLMVLIILVGASWVMVSQGWNLLDSIYFCVVTSTTVGYGDLTVKGQFSRAFFTVYILLSVLTIGAAVGSLSSIRAEIKAHKKKFQHLARELDLSMIRALDEDNNGVSFDEFLIGMLVQTGVLKSKDEVTVWKKRFDDLDVDKDGMLTEADIKKIETDINERKARLLSESI